MKKNIKLLAKQIYEDNIEESIIETQGEVIDNNDKLELKFVEEIENQKIEYDIIVKKEKVIYRRADTILLLEKNVKTKSKYKTPYGNMDLSLFLKDLTIIQNENLVNIKLKYDIEFENMNKYESIIELVIR